MTEENNKIANPTQANYLQEAKAACNPIRSSCQAGGGLKTPGGPSGEKGEQGLPMNKKNNTTIQI